MVLRWNVVCRVSVDCEISLRGAGNNEISTAAHTTINEAPLRIAPRAAHTAPKQLFKLKDFAFGGAEKGDFEFFCRGKRAAFGLSVG
jgi:hypothetical protein